MEVEGHTGLTWTKAIPEQRDRLQSQILVWVVGTLLAAGCLQAWLFAPSWHMAPEAQALALSAAFAILVVMLRAGTVGAACCGGMICFLTMVGSGASHSLATRSALPPLVALFGITFVATRLGRARKASAGLAESRRGRSASQVIANLGVAGLVACPQFALTLGWSPLHSAPRWSSAFPLQRVGLVILAVFVEATADTVASEIGQAFGRRPFLLTTLKRVDPGTDGAVSLVGTASAIAAGIAVAAVGAWSLDLTLAQSSLAVFAGMIGFLVDTLLGALVERKGWLGNDLVNFSATLASAIVAYLLVLS